LKIKSIIWLPDVIEKLEAKHSVTVEEVEEVFEVNDEVRTCTRLMARQRQDDICLSCSSTSLIVGH
jgi:maleate cis-trans isomerase